MPETQTKGAAKHKHQNNFTVSDVREIVASFLNLMVFRKVFINNFSKFQFVAIFFAFFEIIYDFVSDLLLFA